MKKIRFALLAFGCAMLLAGCSNSNSSSSGTTASQTESKVSSNPSEKTAKLLNEVEFPEMVEVTEDKFSFYYKTDTTDVESYSAYVCGSGAHPDEFGVFVMKSEQAANSFISNIESRVEKQKDTYTDYTPAEMYKFDDCFFKHEGNTVYYAICADNVTAEDILG